MATASVRSTTNDHRRVASPELVARFMAAAGRHAATIKNTLRWALSRTRRGQARVPYARSMAKSVLSGNQCKAVEIVTALVMDAAQRGDLEEAESIGYALVAVARSEWAGAHPTEARPRLSRAEAHMIEEAAQGERECAEVAMSNFPTESNKLRFLAADAKYLRAATSLADAVRLELAVGA